MSAPLLAPLAMSFIVLLAAATPQESQVPGPGTDVERTTLHPGQSVSFTLAAGKSHQLLHHVAAGAPHSITIAYQVAGNGSVIVASSRTGYDTRFSILADPDGNGGFMPEGELALPGNGTKVSKAYPGSLGTINVGDFVGGPLGDVHAPAGE